MAVRYPGHCQAENDPTAFASVLRRHGAPPYRESEWPLPEDGTDDTVARVAQLVADGKDRDSITKVRVARYLCGLHDLIATGKWPVRLDDEAIPVEERNRCFARQALAPEEGRACLVWMLKTLPGTEAGSIKRAWAVPDGRLEAIFAKELPPSQFTCRESVFAAAAIEGGLEVAKAAAQRRQLITFQSILDLPQGDLALDGYQRRRGGPAPPDMPVGPVLSGLLDLGRRAFIEQERLIGQLACGIGLLGN